MGVMKRTPRGVRPILPQPKNWGVLPDDGKCYAEFTDSWIGKKIDLGIFECIGRRKSTRERRDRFKGTIAKYIKEDRSIPQRWYCDKE